MAHGKGDLSVQRWQWICTKRKVEDQKKTRNSDEGNRILERPVSKFVLLVEQECVQFPDVEVQKE